MSYRSWPPSSGSYAPLTYLRGFPVDVTTLLVGIHILTMVVSAIAMTVMAGGMLESFSSIVRWFGFIGEQAIRGKVWTVATYPFVHNIAMQHIWFAIDMLLFFWFGREVERHIGRNAFIWFYALLVTIPAVVIGLSSVVMSANPLFGSRIIHFAVFIGFVTIYPNVQFFFGLIAKWLAWGFLGIFTLSALVQKDWSGMLYLWTTCGLAWFLLRSAGVGGGFSWFESMEGWKEQRQEEKARARREAYERQKEQEENDVDAILEKISKEGIQSLNPEEKKLLERASRDLHQKDGK